MRSLHVSETNGVFHSRLAESEPPRPRGDEVLVRVSASGVNRADLSQIAGHYPPPPGESSLLGLEVSGIVESTGEEVCALLAGGGHAERVAVPRGQLLRSPRGLDAIAAAAIPEAWITAFLNLVVECGLSSGDTLLVHAGASGVGLAAIALARRLGARVAATTRTAAKCEPILAAGADLAIDTSKEDFSKAVQAKWGEGCVDVILDPVGAANLAGDLRILATGGRVVFLSTMSGAKAELDIRALMARRGRLIGSMLRSRSREEKKEIVRRFADEVLPGFEDQTLCPVIDSVFAPEDAAKAFTRMGENRSAGKIVIDWRSASAREDAGAGDPDRKSDPRSPDGSNDANAP